ncbi:GNAT family N-acetyltransferase [Ornithinibacillus halophilus]|uniref:Ribosomal protein S18 acetylase RimI n=1 Tax=Ornithinibacillus halophilus TaxID=930117 RepID=A0A1M5HRS1_9BACI|nr:GNAT family protein [Ornithinibacillus halophilus]SHG18669.1 Ribosomal protein S18 acetylase RimI [Ornithinibacillus halophilus]
MSYIIKKMTQKHAIEILTWKYEKPYDFYNNVLSGDALLELQNGSYRTVHSPTRELIGFFCFGSSAQVHSKNHKEIYKDNCLDIGIGMKPERTGQGNGHLFFANILQCIEEEFPKSVIRLTVASFNKRAIHLYEKFNFVQVHEFSNSRATFITMIKKK